MVCPFLTAGDRVARARRCKATGAISWMVFHLVQIKHIDSRLRLSFSVSSAFRQGRLPNGANAQSSYIDGARESRAAEAP